MQLFFAGAEVTSHFAVLKECGVERVAVSASNLARVAKDKLPLWASRARLAGLEWILYADSAQTPVSIVTGVLAGADVQPEAVAGPLEWYDTTWLKDSDLLFLPTWDGTDPSRLREYAEDFSGVMLPDSTVDNPAHVRAAKAALPTLGVLGALTGRTKGLERFDMLCSSAWWAVQKHGETQIWTGDRFVRLNAEDKILKRHRYADQIAALGVDVDKVLADDPNEMLRLAVKSWLKLEQHLASGHTAQFAGKAPTPLVTSTHPSAIPANVVPIQAGVARPPSLTRHQMLPVIDLHRSSVVVQDANGHDVTETSETLSVNPVSMRQCNTCSLQIGCPPVPAARPVQLPDPGDDPQQGGTQWGPPSLGGDPDTAHPAGPFRGGSDWERRRAARQRDGSPVQDGRALAGASRTTGTLSRSWWTPRETPRRRWECSPRLFGEKAGANAMLLEEPLDADEVLDHLNDDE